MCNKRYKQKAANVIEENCQSMGENGGLKMSYKYSVFVSKMYVINLSQNDVRQIKSNSFDVSTKKQILHMQKSHRNNTFAIALVSCPYIEQKQLLVPVGML